MQFRNGIPRSFQSYKFETEVLQYDVKVLEPLQNEEVLQNSAALVSLLLHCSKILLVLLCLNPQKTMPNSLNPRKMRNMVRLEQVDFQKRSQKYPMSSVCQAATKNRGRSHLQDSESSRVHWERGTFQSCVAVSGSKKSHASFKEFTLSCNS